MRILRKQRGAKSEISICKSDDSKHYVMAFMAAVEKITIYLPEEHDWVISKWENI